MRTPTLALLALVTAAALTPAQAADQTNLFDPRDGDPIAIPVLAPSHDQTFAPTTRSRRDGLPRDVAADGNPAVHGEAAGAARTDASSHAATDESKETATMGLKIHEPVYRIDVPTLESVFEAEMAPSMKLRKQQTKLRQYRNSISRFTGFLKNAVNTPSIHGIAEITDSHALEWQIKETENDLKPSTINVHWKRIRAVLRRAGPAEKGNPLGLGIIDRVPYLKPLPVPRPRPQVVSLDVIDSLYTFGAADMDWPPRSDGIAPSLRWRAWLVCAYNLAMRTRDLLSLRWENIHLDPQSLDPESDNESPFGWVEWVPKKTAEAKPEALVLPMNQWVRSHIDSIQCDSKYVFGQALATVTDDALYGRQSRPGSGHWPRLVELASHHHRGGIRPFTIKTFRKTSNTQYKRLNPKLGDYVLGHAPRGVNDMFYTQWEADVIEYVSQLRQPASFLRPVSEPARQEFLF